MVTVTSITIVLGTVRYQKGMDIRIKVHFYKIKKTMELPTWRTKTSEKFNSCCKTKGKNSRKPRTSMNTIWTTKEKCVSSSKTS